MKKKRIAAGLLALVMLVTMIPVQTVSAKPAKMKLKDFNYTEDGYEASFLDKGDEDGGFDINISKKFVTYRGIKIGSKWSTVKKKYGNTTKKKVNKNEGFYKYVKAYQSYFGYTDVNLSKWKYYAEYAYKKNTKNDLRLRFYMDKNSKVVSIVFIDQYKKQKLSNKKVNIGFRFKAPSGKKITTKKINGKKVQVLPKNTKIVFNKSKVPEFGFLSRFTQIDKKGKVHATSLMPINFTWACKSGTKVKDAMEHGMFDNTVKKSYNYYTFTIYDIDAKGGYDIPATYYFRIP